MTLIEVKGKLKTATNEHAYAMGQTPTPADGGRGRKWRRGTVPVLLSLQSGGQLVFTGNMTINATMRMWEGLQENVHSVVRAPEMGSDVTQGPGKSCHPEL